MKYVFIFFALPLFCFSQEWKSFTVDSLGFTVETPYPLVNKNNEAMTDIGLQRIISYGILAPEKHHNYLYQILVIPYPENTFHSDSIALQKEVLQGFIDASHVENAAEKIYQTSFIHNGEDFEQWVIHIGEDYSIKSRAIIKSDRLYMIQVMTEFEHSVNTDIDKFLNSFVFLYKAG